MHKAKRSSILEWREYLKLHYEASALVTPERIWQVNGQLQLESYFLFIQFNVNLLNFLLARLKLL